MARDTENYPTAVETVPGYKRTRAWTWARETRIGDWTRSLRRCSRELAAWGKAPDFTGPTVNQLETSLALLPVDSQSYSRQQELDSPIFLLSTGWRAGSTLLQRILVTDPSLLLWGEPLAEMTIVSVISDKIANFISARNLQLWKDQHDPSSSELSTSWVANLYPPASDFRSGLRSLFDQWLREPACQRHFSRWGFKEVRFGAAEATLLRWLYPNAKFLIISRHPFDAYRSLADSGWGEVYYRYPDIKINSAVTFARHWDRLASSWSQLPPNFPALHVKYEDLIAGKVDFRQIESWLGIEVKEDLALSASVGGTAKRARLGWYERLIILREAADGMRLLGYSK